MQRFPSNWKQSAPLAARNQAPHRRRLLNYAILSSIALFPFPFPATNPVFDLLPAASLPRQRSLLQALVPVLAALDTLDAVLLSGSLARLDADNWSSVDLCLIWRIDDQGTAMPARRDQLEDALDRALGKGGFQLGPTSRIVGVRSLLGITLAGSHPCGGSGQNVESGVLFRFSWEEAASQSELWRRSGPFRPIYLSQRLSPEQRASLEGLSHPLGQPDPDLVRAQLVQFWLLLAQLPAVLARQENLAAHALLADTRALLLDLVVALNGAARPRTTARINQFLGPEQLHAFEKGMGMGPTSSERGSPNSSWIGQAVALIVLYRWYAPQLSEIFRAPYPQQAEDTVLALMRARINGWPAVIETG